MYSIIIAHYIDITYPKDSERSMQRKATFQINALFLFSIILPSTSTTSNHSFLQSIRRNPKNPEFRFRVAAVCSWKAVGIRVDISTPVVSIAVIPSRRAIHNFHEMVSE
jgi:hypothetical protein